MSSATHACAAVVRRADQDRYFSALFAPPDKRALLFVLYAFNVEIARIAETVHEPMMGEIRLQWWRETLEGARAGTPRNHDMARALADLFAAADLPLDLFEAMIGRRAFDFSSDNFADRAAIETYCDATSGNLMRLAGRILGSADDKLAREAGIAYALTGILRSIAHHASRHKSFVPESLMQAVGLSKEQFFAKHGRDRLKAVTAQMALWAAEHLAAARAIGIERNALPAYLPASLVPLYLRRVTRRGFDPLHHTAEVALHRRQMRLLAASMRCRI